MQRQRDAGTEGWMDGRMQGGRMEGMEDQRNRGKGKRTDEGMQGWGMKGLRKEGTVGRQARQAGRQGGTKHYAGR